MDDHFTEAERLLEYLRDDTGDIQRYASNDLLTGIDHLCRSVLGVVANDFKPVYWNELHNHSRKMISYAYRGLGRQGERLFDELMVPVEYELGRHHNEIDDLVHDSSVAQTIASISYFESDKLNPKIMKMLTYASLDTFIVARPLFKAVPKAKYEYYNGNISSGLTRIERTITDTRR